MSAVRASELGMYEPQLPLAGLVSDGGINMLLRSICAELLQQ